MHKHYYIKMYEARILYLTHPQVICDSWQSAYLQLSDLVVSLLKFNLREVPVQLVHLFRVRHRMNS